MSTAEAHFPKSGCGLSLLYSSIQGLLIYPAGGNGDGTPAGALAAMLASLSAADIATLASLDYRQLYAAGLGAQK